DAEAGKHRGERGRAALVLALREERHLRELDPLGQPGRQALAQLRGLRPQARAAGEQGGADPNKNARCEAGVLGLAAAKGQGFQPHQMTATTMTSSTKPTEPAPPG